MEEKNNTNNTINTVYRLIDNSDISEEKKDFLKNYKIFGIQCYVPCMERLQKMEDELGKPLKEFDENEIISLFSTSGLSRASRDIAMLRAYETDDDAALNHISFFKVAKTIDENKYIEEDELDYIKELIINIFDENDSFYYINLIDILLRGVTINQIVHIKREDIDYENGFLELDDKFENRYSLYIGKEFAERLLKNSYITYTKGRFGLMVAYEDTDNVFKTLSDIDDYNKVQYYSQLFSRKISSKLKDMVEPQVLKKFRPRSLNFTGRFLFIKKRADQEGLNFIEDVLRKRVNNLEKYNQIIKEYDPSSDLTFYEMRKVYHPLCSKLVKKL